MGNRVRRIDFMYQDKRYKVNKEHDTDEDKDAKYVLNVLGDAFANGLELEFMKEFIRNLRQMNKNELFHGVPVFEYPVRDSAYHAAMEWDF